MCPNVRSRNMHSKKNKPCFLTSLIDVTDFYKRKTTDCTDFYRVLPHENDLASAERAQTKRKNAPRAPQNPYESVPMGLRKRIVIPAGTQLTCRRQSSYSSSQTHTARTFLQGMACPLFWYNVHTGVQQPEAFQGRRRCQRDL